MKIELTPIDLKILTNFSKINANFTFEEDSNVFKSSDQNRKIIAEYKSETNIKERIELVDLRTFLLRYDEFKDGSITKKDNIILFEKGKVSYQMELYENYFKQPKDITNLDVEVSFDWSKDLFTEVMSKINKSGKSDYRKLDYNVCYFTAPSGEIELIFENSWDPQNASRQDKITYKTGVKSNRGDLFYIFNLSFIEHLFVSDYVVDVKPPVVSFTNKYLPLTYKFGLKPIDKQSEIEKKQYYTNNPLTTDQERIANTK